MTTLALVIIAGILTLAAVRSSYPFLRFAAGVAWWGLGAWWIYNPLVAGGNPVNDIMLILVFFGGLALMFMMNWRTQTANGREEGGFNIRIPKMFGGQSEEEEIEERRRSARTYHDRQADYGERLNTAIRGRRPPR